MAWVHLLLTPAEPDGPLASLNQQNRGQTRVCPRFSGFRVCVSAMAGHALLRGCHDRLPTMPRRARLRFADVPLHVVQRGNNRGACFFAESDYLVYRAQLSALAERFECAVHAYVLMTNHVHLLLTPAEPDGVSRLMKHLGQRYVQYVNRRHGRTGTLWEGRFHSCIVQAEAYLLACQRYIELNPVRAGMVRDPADYRWSSYAANALGAQDDLVKPHATMLALSANEQRRMQAYRSMFDLTGIADHDVRIRTAMHALGDKLFQRVVLATAGRRI